MINLQTVFNASQKYKSCSDFNIEQSNDLKFLKTEISKDIEDFMSALEKRDRPTFEKYFTYFVNPWVKSLLDSLNITPQRESDGKTPAHIFASQNNIDAIEYLDFAEYDLTIADNEGKTFNQYVCIKDLTRSQGFKFMRIVEKIFPDKINLDLYFNF